MYNYEDIVWLKNVLNAQGSKWAYENVSYSEPFPLHWSDKQKSSAKRPETGEIILLFQKPQIVNGVSNSKVYLTHLVTPVDEVEYRDFENVGFSYYRLVRLLAIANPINKIPNPGNLNFHKPNRGHTNPIENLGDRRSGATVADIQKLVFELFRDCFPKDMEFFMQISGNKEVFNGVAEGNKTLKSHSEYEKTIRNSGIIKLVKFIAFHKGNGYIQCECCGFDFRRTYGDLGIEFIECHHKTFLSAGERVTSVDDLALVCSNCHQMLHKRNSNGDYYSIKELKQLITSNRNLVKKEKHF